MRDKILMILIFAIYIILLNSGGVFNKIATLFIAILTTVFVMGWVNTARRLK